MNIHNKKRAFTLVELIIVIAVIGILAAVLIVVLPSVINKANAKSALQDARNAYNNYLSYTKLEKGREEYENILFTVEKSDKLYVYGYRTYSNELFVCASNPFENEEPASLVNKLVEAGTVEKSGSKQADISAEIGGLPESVHCFAGYRLLDVTEDTPLFDGYIYLTVGETRPIELQGVANIENMNATVENEAVATCQNGSITGVSEGETVLVLTSGDTSYTLKITVGEFELFGGTMSEFKAIVESRDTAYTFIKLEDMHLLISDDHSLFPITVPKGKTVKIDLNRGAIYAEFNDNESQDEYIEAVFLNDGGNLIIETSNVSSGSINTVALSNRNLNTHAGSVIINRNGGSFETSGIEMWIVNEGYYTPDVSMDPVIMNSAGSRCVLNETEISGDDCDSVIYNAAEASLVLNDCEVWQGHQYSASAIINDGTIERISGGLIYSDKGISITNNGSIVSMSGVTVNRVVTAQDEESYSTCVLGTSGSSIGEITDVSIIVVEAIPNETSEGISVSVIELESGARIGSITGGEFIGYNTCLKVSGDGADGVISGGSFSHKVADRLLADGYVCEKDEDTGRFVVTKEQS